MKSFGERIPFSLPTRQPDVLWKGIILLGTFGVAAFLGLLVPLLGLDPGSALAAFLAFSLIIGFFIVTYFAARSRPWALLIFLGISVFLIDATFRRRELAEQGLDLQTTLKIVVWSAALLIAFVATSKFFASMFRGDLKWLTMFSLLGLGSTVYSLTPAYTFGSGVAAISYCALAVCVAEHLTKRQILYSLLIGVSIILVLSLAVYVLGGGMTAPEAGSVMRLGGIAGSPNGLGRTASLAILVVGVLVFGHHLSFYSWRCLVPLGLALPCLVLSDSRTATIAVLAAFGLYFFRLRPLLGFIAATAGGVAVLLLFNLDIAWDDLGKSLARTGRVSEMTTLTGRTDVWYETWKAFLDQPLLGYGFAATRVLLPEVYRGYWGFTVGQAHNFILQTAVTTGIVGLGFVLMLLVRQAVAYITRIQLFSGSIFIYLLITGITEAGPAGPAPNLLYLFWALSLCWDRVRDDPLKIEIVDAPPRQRGFA